jgi:hypothetical protein
MLPVKDPAGLLVAGRQQRNSVQTGFTYSQYRLIRDNNAVADLAGYTIAPINVSVDGPPEPSIQGQLVSGGYFALLGVNPAIGRAIGPDDDRVPNGHPVAMLSHGYGSGGSRAIARHRPDDSSLGDAVHGSSAKRPAEFFGVEIGTPAPDIFLPLMMQPTVMPSFENLLNPIVSRNWVQVIARAKPGVRPSGGRGTGRRLSERRSQPTPGLRRKQGRRGVDAHCGRRLESAPGSAALFDLLCQSVRCHRLRQHGESAPGARRALAAGSPYASPSGGPRSPDAAAACQASSSPLGGACGGSDALVTNAGGVYVVGTHADRARSRPISDSRVHGGGVGVTGLLFGLAPWRARA